MTGRRNTTSGGKNTMPGRKNIITGRKSTRQEEEKGGLGDDTVYLGEVNTILKQMTMASKKKAVIKNI